MLGPPHTPVPAICVNPDITMIPRWQIVAAPGADSRKIPGLSEVRSNSRQGRIAQSSAMALSMAAMGAGTPTIMIGDTSEHDLCGAGPGLPRSGAEGSRLPSASPTISPSAPRLADAGSSSRRA